MAERHMDFLDTCKIVMGNDHGELRRLGETPPAVARERERVQPQAFCRFDGPNDIGRGTARRERQQNVPLLTPTFKLP
jgi:hypothetical protein